MATKNKRVWQTYFNRHEEVVSESGTGIKQEWQLVIDDYGNETFEKCGETNIYEKIQSYADSVDVNRIINRVMQGDSSLLEKVKGFHADVSQMQTDFRELYNLNIRGEKMFDELPAEIKQAFDGSYYKFVTEPERLEKFNKAKQADDKSPIKDDGKKEEVATDE